jgi:hypothetical protein
VRVRSAGGALALALALAPACAAPAAAADAAHPGALAIDRAGAVVVASGVANGEVPTIVRIGADRRLRVVHRFARNDTPGALARVGAYVVGIDGLPESRGRAFVVDGDRFRSVYSVPDDGYGTIAYVDGALAGAGFAFGIDGGRGAACRARKGHSPCGAIEMLGPDGRARRVATFASAAAPWPLAGDGRAAWFSASAPARLLVLRGGRVTDVGTGGRPAVAAAPFGAGALVALRDAHAVSLAPVTGAALAPGGATIATAGADADVTLRARGRTVYAIVAAGGTTTLYALAPANAPRAVRSWSGDFVRLHFVDASGAAVISAEQRTVGDRVATRGALWRIAPNGTATRLPLGALGERAAVDDAIEGPDGAVWSLLTFYGSARGVVRSDRTAATVFPLAAGTGSSLRKN